MISRGSEFNKLEDIINPLYNNSITKYVLLNNKPRIYLVEFRNQLLGCEKRDDGYWYGITGKNDKQRELISNTLKDMGYEIVYRDEFLGNPSFDFSNLEIHIIKEIPRDD